MSAWPDFDTERLTGALLRVDLHEGRYLAAREYPKVVEHLMRSAAAACLLDREELANTLIQRAGERVAEWVDLAINGVRVPEFDDLAAARGFLMLALAADADQPESRAQRTARAFLAHTADAPPGPTHNARLAAALLVNDSAALVASAKAIALLDPGLGPPWRRFALALDARDPVTVVRSAEAWLRDRMESTSTNATAAYDEVPLEVSGALRLAALRGMPVRLESLQVLPRFRGLSLLVGR
jgi:hypothetical protein